MTASDRLEPTRRVPAGIDLFCGTVPDENWTNPLPDVTTEEERTTANRFKFERDQRRYLATRRMVRNLLSRYADIEPHAWKFETNEFGKPRICAEQDFGLHFNVSHTSSIIVCALAAFPSIGVDVEANIPNKYHDVANRFYATEEQQWLRQAESTEEEDRRFLYIWTLKEAYIKAVGQGLSIPLTSFSVFPNDGREFVIDQNGSKTRWSFRRYEVANAPIAVVFPSEFDSLSCQLHEIELS